MSDKLKKQMMNLLLFDTDSKRNEEISDFQDNDLNILGDSSSFTSFEELDTYESLNICTGPYCNKAINMISSKQEFLLYIIDKIDDPEIKKEYFLKLKNFIIKAKVVNNLEPYKLTDTSKI